MNKIISTGNIPILDPRLSTPEFVSFVKEGKAGSCDTTIPLGETDARLTGYARAGGYVLYIVDFSGFGYISFSDIGALYFISREFAGHRPVSKDGFFEEAAKLSSQKLSEWLIWNLA